LPKRGVPAGLAKGDGISNSGINLGGWIPFRFGDVDVEPVEAVGVEVEGASVLVVVVVEEDTEGDPGLRVDECETDVGLSVAAVGVSVAGPRGLAADEPPKRLRAARAAASRGEGSPAAVSLALSDVEESVDAVESVDVDEEVDVVDVTVDVDVEACTSPEFP
jgi:hypothetical protein